MNNDAPFKIPYYQVTFEQMVSLVYGGYEMAIRLRMPEQMSEPVREALFADFVKRCIVKEPGT